MHNIRKQNKRGFALIVAMTLMALLVAIMVSISTVTQVEVQASVNQKQLAEARQNAVYGLNVAIGQLQRYAGADQRISAPATTVYPQKDVTRATGELYDDSDFGYRSFAQISSERSYLDRVETYLTPAEREEWEQSLRDWWNDGRNPHWVGIFDSSMRVDRSTDPTSDPDVLDPRSYPQIYESEDAVDYGQSSSATTLFGEPQRDQLPVWLISGNEHYNFDPRDPNTYPGLLADGSGDYITPDIDLNEFFSDDELVYLVHEGSATDEEGSTDGLIGFVRAPKMEISGARDDVSGHYAYWVGDESLKANFAVRDTTMDGSPQNYPNELESNASSALKNQYYRARLQVPQRVGWDNMSGFDEAFNLFPNDPTIDRVLTRNQIALLDENFEDDPTEEFDSLRGPIPRNFHSITGASKSLLTDTALGGVKKNLMDFLENGNGLDLNDAIFDIERYDENDARFAAWDGTNTGFPNNTENLDNIPTWRDLYEWYNNSARGGVTEVKPDERTAPIITQIHVGSGLSFNDEIVNWHFVPTIVLWNPYDVPLDFDTYELDMVYAPDIAQGFLVRQRPSNTNDLPTAQAAADANADWELIVPSSMPTHSDDSTISDIQSRRVLMSNSNTDVVWVYNSGSYREMLGGDQPTYVFKGKGPAAVGDAWYAMISGVDPDTVDLTSGPWPKPDNKENGATDAFGRVYYWLNAIEEQKSFERNGRRNANNMLGGPLGGSGSTVQNMSIVYAPFYEQGDFGRDEPITGKLRFSISTGFAAGEVKVFSVDPVGPPQEFDPFDQSSRVELIDDFDSAFPNSMYFKAFEVENAEPPKQTDTLLFMAEFAKGFIVKPKYEFRLGPSTILSEAKIGIGLNAWDLVKKGFQGYYGRLTNRFIDEGKADANGNATPNWSEPIPRFIDDYRLVPHLNDFSDKILSQDLKNTEGSMWSMGANWLQPFTSPGGIRASDASNFMPVFSRFNLGARSFDPHPFIDALRENDVVNNEGFGRFTYTRSKNEPESWDFGGMTAAGTSRGFALITPQSREIEELITTPQYGAEYDGVSLLPIRNARREKTPILSLGQLQQANLAKLFWQPSFPVGNSYAPVYVDRNAVAGINSREVARMFVRPQGGPGARFSPAPIPNQGRVENFDRDDFGVLVLEGLDATGNQSIDISYLLNENLWDRYFLSSQSGETLPTQYPELMNSRYRFIPEAEDFVETEPDALLDFNTAGYFIENYGALNVNSTSVEAWRALLTAFRDLRMTGSFEDDENPPLTVPIARTLDPIQGAIDMAFSDYDGAGIDQADIGILSGKRRDYQKIVSGFRYLTDEMIDVLAKRIVDEIRLRGPFYSMSDFVNRRLVAPDGMDGISGGGLTTWEEARSVKGFSEPKAEYYGNIAADYDPFIGLQGLSGTLQRAIQLSGINGGVNDPRLGFEGNLTGDRDDRVFGAKIMSTGDSSGFYQSDNVWGGVNPIGGSNNEYPRHTYEPTLRNYTDSEHFAGAPAGEVGQLLDGAPGFVTQGDLLAMIGPALTARGDTFLIRTYGDSVNPITGEVTGRAWLEAVVQRTIEPVEGLEEPIDYLDVATLQPVTRFGRKFKVVSLRWLSEDEI